jgi:excisionase family DNA binding protein
MSRRDDDKLSGAKAIANEIYCSVDTVYRLAARGSAPIYKPGGRYISSKTELRAWMRTKPAMESQNLPDCA